MIWEKIKKFKKVLTWINIYAKIQHVDERKTKILRNEELVKVLRKKKDNKY